jgi:hypothetical protein
MFSGVAAIDPCVQDTVHYSISVLQTAGYLLPEEFRVDRTVWDIDSAMRLMRVSPARSERTGKVSASIAVLCIFGALTLLGVLLYRLPRRETAVFQRGYILPAPQPIPRPALSLPAVTVTLPAAPPPVYFVPPPRPSLWEIRAELKRGLGEWEFPHYVNAPHYGSGPDSATPSQIKPHLASAWAE